MKRFYGKTAFVLILTASFLILCGLSAFCQDKPAAEGQPAPKKVKTLIGAYYWQEFTPDKTTMNYYYVPIARGNFDGRLDYINLPQTKKDVYRLRLHYGKFFLSSTKGANVYLQPGGMIDDQGKVYYGGQMIAKFPGLGLSVTQKSYAGNKTDYHQTFVELNLYKPLNVMYYQYSQKNAEPTCVVGPLVRVGSHGYVFYGFPTNGKKISVINGGVNFRF